MTVPRLITLDEALRWRDRAPGPVVFTNGVFDLLHPGHVALLEAARAHGESMIVALNSDRSVRTLHKGDDRPVVPEGDRARMVGALRCVDRVILFDDHTPLRLIEALSPDVLVKGGDYTPETVVGASHVLAHGGRVVIVPLVPDHSTTRLLERLRAPS